MRAASAATDLMETDTRQCAARQVVQVGLEAPGRVAHESRLVGTVASDEGRTHVGPDFERRGTDRRSEPCHELARLRLQRRHGGFEHAAD